MFAERSRAYGAHFAFCNLVGGQDELVFDGQSLVIAPDGACIARAAQFEEELLVCELPHGAPGPLAEPLADLDEVYEALILGLRDYVGKNGFKHVGVALSGGIDSALVALIAADALGPERVTCVVMPSPHSSAETQADARDIAANLGSELIEIPIEPMMEAYERRWRLPGRARGGGAARPDPPLRARPGGGEHPGPDPRQPDDGPLQPPRLARPHDRQQERDVGRLRDPLRRHGGRLRRDQGRAEDPRLRAGAAAERAGRAPTGAGLGDRAGPLGRAAARPARQDSLPPYELLDRILEAYVERDQGREEMIAEGLPAETVDEVIRLVDRSEYKRRQAPPGIRITPKAFGSDRRLPITNRFGG